MFDRAYKPVTRIYSKGTMHSSKSTLLKQMQYLYVEPPHITEHDWPAFLLHVLKRMFWYPLIYGGDEDRDEDEAFSVSLAI